MKSIELGDRGTAVVELHDAVTVVKVDPPVRDEVVDRLTTSLGASAVVRASDVPQPSTAPRVDLVDAEAGVAAAEAAVADARTALALAEREYAKAEAAMLEANRAIDKSAGDAVAAAEARLEVAQAGAAAARRALVQAREEHGRRVAEERVEVRRQREEITRLRERRDALDAERGEILEKLGALPAPADPGPVENALAGLHRLQQVKPRPSERGAGLADRWVAIRERLAELPQPPSPPEWLVTPALRALQEARDAVAAAESLSANPADPVKAELVERAHREVLEAEQRVMRKGSRNNRRRLEQAHDAEKRALIEFGVATYGEFLERVAPGEGGVSVDERIAMARASLADAEAVWEELHGGEASPEYTAAKTEQAEIRSAAHALLGEDVDDDALESRLRSHLETVVDTDWASEQLTAALEERGVEVTGDGDALEAAARAWLDSIPAARAAREEVEARLAEIDAELHTVEAKLADHGATAFFGDDASSDSPTEPDADPFSELAAALNEAEQAEREAVDALREARHRLEQSEQATGAASARESDTDVARAAVDEATDRLRAAEASLSASRDAAVEATRATATAAAAVGAASGGRSIAVEAWLLARLATARATSADAPVVVDARVVAGHGSLRLLERVSASGQVVVLGDEGDVAAWAASLGERAAVRTI